MTASNVTSLDVLRMRMRAEVLRRYNVLRGRSVPDEQARNIAAAQAAVHSTVSPRPDGTAYRRELDAALDPRKPGPSLDAWGLPR
jgi:hypothetical protein